MSTTTDALIVDLARQLAEAERDIRAFQKKANAEFKKKAPACHGDVTLESQLKDRIRATHKAEWEALLAAKSAIEDQLLETTATPRKRGCK